jgi:hypothetical protein
MSSHGLLAVLVVGDMFAPGSPVAVVVDLKHGEVGHEAIWGGAVPVLLAGLEEDRVTGRMTSIDPPRRWHRPMPSVT